MNIVCIDGNLTKDVVTKFTQSDLCIADLSIAVNSKRGENEEVSFFDIVAFGKTAEACGKYLAKGRRVLVTGELKQERWQNDQGQNRSKVVIKAIKVDFVGGKNNSDQPRAEQARPAQGHTEQGGVGQSGAGEATEADSPPF